MQKMKSARIICIALAAGVAMHLSCGSDTAVSPMTPTDAQMPADAADAADHTDSGSNGDGGGTDAAVDAAPTLDELATQACASLGLLHTNGSEFCWANPRPQGRSIEDVRYAAGRWLAVGQNGTILSTTDAQGAGWVTIPSALRGELRAIGYGAGRWVVIESGRKLWTSTDAVHWSELAVPGQDTLSSIEYANGLWVLVGAGASGAVILTSTDLQTWSPRDAQQTGYLMDVSYGNGRWVAVGEGYPGGPGRERMLTSSDGINWTPGLSPDGPVGPILNAVAYGDGQFLAVGNQGNLLQSADGVAWLRRDAGQSGHLRSVLRAGGRWMASGFVDGLLTSADGIQWSARPAPAGQQIFLGMAFNAGTWLAVGSVGSMAKSSDGGESWSPVASAAFSISDVTSLTAGAGSLQAFLSNGERFTSIDGLSWQKAQSTPSVQLTSGAYGAGQWILSSADGKLYSSSDGRALTQRFVAADPESSLKVAFGGGRWVVMERGGNVFTSADGIQWTTSSVGTGLRTLWDLKYDASAGWIIVGLNGVAYTSLDGMQWTSRTTGTAGDLLSVTRDASGWLAAGVNDTWLSSADGITWQERANGRLGECRHVAYAAGQWTALCGMGQNLSLYVSLDGQQWTRRETAAENVMNGTFYDGRRWLVFGDTGMILAGQRSTL